MTIEDKSREVCHILQAEQGVPNIKAFDPATLMLIISIITQLVRLYRSWPCAKGPEEAVRAAANPGVFGRWRMRRVIQAKMQEQGYSGATTEQIENAIVSSNQRTTVEDMSIFYRDVK